MIKGKDSLPRSLSSCVVYRSTGVGCNSEYVGEACHHISTRVCEHLFTDKNSYVYKHMQSSKRVKILLMRAALKLSIQLKRTIN